jgi:phosphonoacetaldehyde hydrolase
MKIKAVMFDFIGTTVIEKDPSILNRCFVEAFGDHNVIVGTELIKANRGKDKKEMIGGILAQFNFPSTLTEPVLHSFKMHLENNLQNFYQAEGASELIQYLKERNIWVGLGTGLPRDIFQRIFDHLGWQTNSFDYLGIAEETGRGRPYPDMIVDMLKKLNLRNDELLKVGDTIADVLEGKNAKVMTAAILSGTQGEQEILSSQPDLVIRSLKEIRKFLNGNFAE